MTDFRSDPEAELAEMARAIKPGVVDGYIPVEAAQVRAQALYIAMEEAYRSEVAKLPPDEFTPELVILLASNLATNLVAGLKWPTDRSKAYGLGALLLSVDHGVRVRVRKLGMELPR